MVLRQFIFGFNTNVLLLFKFFIMRFTEFKPTYKTKQKFKKFFFPLSFRGSHYARFHLFKFKTVSSKILRIRKPAKPFSFSRYSFFLFKKQQRHVFQIQMKATSYSFINQITISAVQRLLAPFFRGKKIKLLSHLSFSNFSSFNFTKKPLAVRIGGGVGKKIRKTGFFTKPGITILKIYTQTPDQIFLRLIRLKKKFSSSTVITISLKCIKTQK